MEVDLFAELDDFVALEIGLRAARCFQTDKVFRRLRYGWRGVLGMGCGLVRVCASRS